MKLLSLIAILAIAQASLEPLFTSLAEVVPLPDPSKVTVTSWQLATGGTVSSTVTVAPQEETLPFTSVTVKVTVWLGTSAQVNVLSSKEMLAIPQASLEPLFTLLAEVVPLPEPSKVTVTS